MEVLVVLDEAPSDALVFAHVNSAPSRVGSFRAPRDVVRLYGIPEAQSLALALAALVEGRRLNQGETTIRHMGVLAGAGAIGDAAWRDPATGQLMTSDIDIPLETLMATANQLLAECGSAIRRLLAGLAMTDWPEGARRAINFSLVRAVEPGSPAANGSDTMLEKVRAADAYAYDTDEEA
jgi:hypothetical protein